jgi:hypothetical protein
VKITTFKLLLCARVQSFIDMIHFNPYSAYGLGEITPFYKEVSKLEGYTICHFP